MDRIALAIGLDGRLADFFAMIEIRIYEKQDGWAVADRFPVISGIETESAAAVRRKAEDIGKSILERNCHNLIGKEILGMPYHALCRAGLEVFEADEISDKLFDEIDKDYLMKKEDTEKVIEMIPSRPMPADDEGNYCFDFIKAIKCHPELSSKKMLLPFLTNDLFFSLIIRCEHIMPWLDEFVKSHGLDMETKRENGIYEVMITHKSCND